MSEHAHENGQPEPEDQTERPTLPPEPDEPAGMMPENETLRLPWEILINVCGFDFETTADGDMLLVIYPLLPRDAGPGMAGGAMQILSPSIRVRFEREGWETFKKRCALDGAPIPQIPIARTMPR